MSIDGASFAAGVIREIGGDAFAMREVVGRGEVNRVFVATLEGGQRRVVRFCRDLKDAGHYAVEAWCLVAAKRQGVPVAGMIALGELDGVAYIVQSFVEGESADTRRDAGLWRTLGRYARQINGIRIDASAPDELFNRFSRDPVAGWTAHVRYNLDALSPDDPLLALGVYQPGDRDSLLAGFARLAEERYPITLTHGDLAPQNVLISPDGVPTLIDWGSAGLAPAPLADYLRIGDPEQGFSAADLQAFAEGYGIEVGEVIGAMNDLLVLERVDRVRWALDRRPDRLNDLAERARVAVRRWRESSKT